MTEAINDPESAEESKPKSKPLKMIMCGGCGKANFISEALEPFEMVECKGCGHPCMAPVRLRQFELRFPIASGGMGTVYRAFDVMLERDVAVKLMQPQLLEDKQALESFYREARVGAALTHTNIIHIYTFDEWENRMFLVMELADNGSLDSWIQSAGYVPELDVLDTGIKIAEALNMAQKKNILHRDIKPDNILYDKIGEPKLVDFGLAGSQDDEAGDDLWATPYYIAPEKVNREKETFLSDMYSLGGTLYHAMTGHPPFEADDLNDVVAAHVYTELTPPDHVVTEISQPTSDAVCRTLAKDPHERFQSYDDLVMALTSARSQLLVKQLNIRH